MSFIDIKLPPGMVSNGTEYGTKGRYYLTYLVRWNDDGTLKPIGGWRTRSASTVDSAARAIIAWRDNSANTWLGIGTYDKLWASDRSGAVYDITPTGFTAGRIDAIAAGGYGGGVYGAGTYGTPTVDNTLIQDATEWSLDTWGEDLVGVSPDDGKIYNWLLNTAVKAVQVTNSPTCDALVVTPERFMFALGTTDPRTVGWCDQEDDTDWTPTTTNQAGDFPLQTQGRLMCGKAIKGGTLVFTDMDAHLATYIGGTLVWSFDRVGSACGVISRQAVAAIDAQAVWMGKAGFWLYNGSVTPLPCDIQDYIFSNINTLQVSKTYCVRDSANSEIIWYYCSGSSTEIDSCAIWNYKQNVWSIGRPNRLCGTDRGVFTYPIFVDASGNIYEHEVGLAYDGTMPWAEGGPLELGNGDRVISTQALIPDDKTLGDVSATFKTRFYPDDVEGTYGPYSLSAQTDIRFTAREIKVRFDGVRLADWRVGYPRLDAVLGSRR